MPLAAPLQMVIPSQLACRGAVPKLLLCCLIVVVTARHRSLQTKHCSNIAAKHTAPAWTPAGMSAVPALARFVESCSPADLKCSHTWQRRDREGRTQAPAVESSFLPVVGLLCPMTRLHSVTCMIVHCVHPPASVAGLSLARMAEFRDQLVVVLPSLRPQTTSRSSGFFPTLPMQKCIGS